MAGKKRNRRVLYTEKIIKDSFIELLLEKDIQKITVTDICKKADINRGTFYTHYKDTFNLLESMENDFFHQAFTFVENYTDDSLINVLKLIKDNKDLCMIIFCRQIDTKIINKILSIAADVDIVRKFKESNNPYVDYLIKYSVGGCLAIIQSWLEGGLQESPEEILNIIAKVKNDLNIL